MGHTTLSAVSLPPTDGPNPDGRWTPSPATPPPRRPVPATPAPTTADVLVINAPNIINGLISIGDSAYLSIGYSGETRFTAGLGELEVTITGDNILPFTEVRNIVRNSQGNYIIDLSYIDFTFLVELRLVDVSHILEGTATLSNEEGYVTSVEFDGSRIYRVFVEPGVYTISVEGELIVYHATPPNWTITATENAPFVNVSLVGVHFYTESPNYPVLLPGPTVIATPTPQVTPIPETPEVIYDIGNEYTTVSVEESGRPILLILVIILVVVGGGVALFFMYRLYNEYGNKSSAPTIITNEVRLLNDSDVIDIEDATVAEVTDIKPITQQS